MSRSKFSILYEIYDLTVRCYKICRRYKILSVFFDIVLVIILLTVIFAFLSFVQVISPFVYPLF